MNTLNLVVYQMTWEKLSVLTCHMKTNERPEQSLQNKLVPEQILQDKLSRE